MRRPRPSRWVAAATAELEERSGIVGYLRWMTFRNVARSSSWAHTLGAALLAVFAIQVVTGIGLAMYYQPSGHNAYTSIQYITDHVWMGWLLRGLHKWGATFIVVLLFLHMARTFLTGSYKYPREVTWLSGIAMFLLFMAMAFTGYLLVWDQRAFWATVIGVDIAGMTPIIGPWLATAMRGGNHFTDQILPRFYAIHMLVLPGLIFGLLGLHLYLVTKLGVTPEPWDDEDPANAHDAWS